VLKGRRAHRPAIDRHVLALVVSTLVGGMGPLLLLVLALMLFAGTSPGAVLTQFTHSFFWVPVLCMLTFVLAGASWARRVSGAFTLGIVLMSVAYAAWPDRPQRSQQVVFALLQLNLANGVRLDDMG
jgi:hypothetical protein